MEIKSVGGDGVYKFAIIANGNDRRRYRVQRRTGAIEEFAARSGRFAQAIVLDDTQLLT